MNKLIVKQWKEKCKLLGKIIIPNRKHKLEETVKYVKSNIIKRDQN